MRVAVDMCKQWMMKQAPVFLITLVVLFHVFIMAHLLSESKLCRAWDDGHLGNAVIQYSSVGFQGKVQHYKWLLIGPHERVVYECVACVVYELMNAVGLFSETRLIIAVNGFFLGILLMSVYGIGAFLYSRTVGIYSALLLSFLPLVWTSLGGCIIDFPLAAVTALAMLLLIKTENFTHFRYVLLFGAVCGIAQLTKETFASFVIVPGVYVFFCGLRTRAKKSVLKNVFVGCAIFFSIIGWKYFPEANRELYLTPYRKLHEGGAPFLTYVELSLVYVGTFLGVTLIPVFISVAARMRQQNKTLLLWLVGAIAIYHFPENKVARFLLPVMSPFAILMVSECVETPFFGKWLRRVYPLLILIVAVAQHSTLISGGLPHDVFFLRSFLHDKNDFSGIYKVQKDAEYDFMCEIEMALSSFHNTRERPLDVLSIVGTVSVISALQYHLRMNKVPVDIDMLLQGLEHYEYSLDYETCAERMYDADLIISSDRTTHGSDRAQEVFQWCERVMAENPQHFALAGEFTYNEDYTIYVYTVVKKT